MSPPPPNTHLLRCVQSQEAELWSLLTGSHHCLLGQHQPLESAEAPPISHLIPVPTSACPLTVVRSCPFLKASTTPITQGETRVLPLLHVICHRAFAQTVPLSVTLSHIHKISSLPLSLIQTPLPQGAFLSLSSPIHWTPVIGPTKEKES
jgi:hypothetical protein